LEEINARSWYTRQLFLGEGLTQPNESQRRLKVFEKLDQEAVDRHALLAPVKSTLEKGDILDSPRALSTGSNSQFEDCEAV
jgi:hypothetical protein